jgi:hypothetical protein
VVLNVDIPRQVWVIHNVACTKHDFGTADCEDFFNYVGYVRVVVSEELSQMLPVSNIRNPLFLAYLASPSLLRLFTKIYNSSLTRSFPASTSATSPNHLFSKYEGPWYDCASCLILSSTLSSRQIGRGNLFNVSNEASAGLAIS